MDDLLRVCKQSHLTWSLDELEVGDLDFNISGLKDCVIRVAWFWFHVFVDSVEFSHCLVHSSLREGVSYMWPGRPEWLIIFSLNCHFIWSHFCINFYCHMIAGLFCWLLFVINEGKQIWRKVWFIFLFLQDAKRLKLEDFIITIKWLSNKGSIFFLACSSI